MNTEGLYEVLRAILGDRQIHGFWNYEDATLKSGLRSVFLLGRGPEGYALTLSETESDVINPDFPTGDAYAITCYEAGLLLVGGEDGKLRLQTRDVTLDDGGERKRDLLDEFRQKIYEIRDGDAVFNSYQSLVSFVHLLQSPASGGGLAVLTAGAEARVQRPMPDLVI